jgi:hypothetical protein
MQSHNQSTCMNLKKDNANFIKLSVLILMSDMIIREIHMK